MIVQTQDHQLEDKMFLGIIQEYWRQNLLHLRLYGNTLITEGSDGRIFEITEEHEIVWEYISPYVGKKSLKLSMIYRAYRSPYDWVPQLEKPTEVAIERIDNKFFRVPGAEGVGAIKETELKEVSQQKK